METERKPQILLVEDSEADLVLFRMALDENHIEHELVRFEDGADALNALFPDAEQIPELTPDLIVLDLNLPRSEGLDVLRRLRGSPRFAEVPVAVLTSSESPNDRQRSVRLGASRYILKPTEFDEFLKCVGEEIAELLPARRAS